MKPQAHLRRAALRLFGLACICIAGLQLLGCSSFETRWDAAGASQPAAPHSLEGRWEGTWTSEGDGHTGSLRCIITRKEGDAYQADFHATFWAIFQFGYGIELHASETGPGRYHFQGDSDLGWLAGGKYHYDGTAQVADDSKPAVFTCTYKSAADHGRFDMVRPP